MAIVVADEKKENELLEKLGGIIKKEGAIKDEKVVVLNGVRIETLRANQLGADLKKTDVSSIVVNISHPDSPSVGLSIDESKTKSTGIGIFQKGTGKPYVNIVDLNGDGVFDLLTYSILNKKGEWIAEIEDYGMNGVIDFRTFIKEKRSEVYYQNKWYKVQKEGNERWIVVNKLKRPLKDVLNELGRNKF